MHKVAFVLKRTELKAPEVPFLRVAVSGDHLKCIPWRSVFHTAWQRDESRS